MAREICELVSVEEETPGGPMERKVAGTVTLDNGKLTYKANTGYDLAMARVMQTPVKASEAVGDQPPLRVTAQSDPALWFHKLPWAFSGAYFYARMVT